MPRHRLTCTDEARGGQVGGGNQLRGHGINPIDAGWLLLSVVCLRTEAGSSPHVHHAPAWVTALPAVAVVGARYMARRLAMVDVWCFRFSFSRLGGIALLLLSLNNWAPGQHLSYPTPPSGRPRRLMSESAWPPSRGPAGARLFLLLAHASVIPRTFVPQHGTAQSNKRVSCKELSMMYNTGPEQPSPEQPNA
jgi:hypothetical protein